MKTTKEKIIEVLNKYIEGLPEAEYVYGISEKSFDSIASELESLQEDKEEDDEIDLSRPDYHNQCEKCGNIFWTKDALDTICEGCKSSITIKLQEDKDVKKQLIEHTVEALKQDFRDILKEESKDEPRMSAEERVMEILEAFDMYLRKVYGEIRFNFDDASKFTKNLYISDDFASQGKDVTDEMIPKKCKSCSFYREHYGKIPHK